MFRMDDLFKRPHRRFNPLTGEWVLVSPHRFERPWEGESVSETAPQRAAYEPECYLCPGNVRANGERNPRYDGTFVFENDYAALVDDPASGDVDDEGLLRAQRERGRCRVVCFSPRHDLDMGSMETAQVRRVVDTWAAEYRELSALPYVSAVTVFENRGSMMGASNPHPHGQIWANESVPNELSKEMRGVNEYAATHGGCLLCEYAEREIALETRVVYSDEHICAIVPFWAIWPFELLVLPRRHAGSLEELAGEERDALASAMQTLVRRYDGLFSTAFPYSMGFHQLPFREPRAQFHLHAHYYPPLLRSASVKKYMVGYEMLAQPQRDITPESAAERLRNA